MEKLELAGKTFGHWKVIKEDSASRAKRSYWICQCICGEERSVSGSTLINGSSISCGCFGGEQKSFIDATDFIDKKFGRLLVISIAAPVIDSDGKQRTAYLCRCECNNELIIKRHALQGTENVKSCGCLLAEQRSNLGLSRRKYEPMIATARAVFARIYTDGDLLFDDFYLLSQQICYYCGGQPSNSYNKYTIRGDAKVSDYAIENGTFIYNGLDRINSSFPHNKDNVVPCCFPCNRMKSNMSRDEFREHIANTYNHWASKDYSETFEDDIHCW